MNQLKICLAPVVLALAVLASPAMAASSAITSISDSIVTSVGSLLGSLKHSSKSSYQATGLAEGDYKIIEVAAVPEQPGMARMTLQAVANTNPDDEVYLYLPLKTVESSHLAQGHVVTAFNRPYGIEFAKADTKQAFYLLLEDKWYRELQSNVVVM
jgi:hypothetical protein